jgi:hypothetical protein
MRTFDYPQTTVTPYDMAYPPITLDAFDTEAARPFWPLDDHYYPIFDFV